MPTLRRYVTTRFLLAFSGALLILGLLVLVIDLMLHVEDLREGDRGLGAAFQLLGLRAAALYLPHLLPLATFIGAFLATGLAARSQEMIAIRAAGISPSRALVPVFIAAALLSAVTLALSETVSVRAAAALERRTGDGRADLFQSADGIWYHTGRFVYNVRSADEAGDRLEEVRIFERDGAGRLLRVIEAARADRVAGSLWRFEEARVRTYDPDRPREAPAFERAERIELALEENEHEPRLRGDLESLPVWVLARAQSRAKGSGGEADRVRTAFHQRLSHPLLTLVLAFLGVPLGLSVERARSLARPLAQGAFALFLLYTAREYAGSVLGHGGAAVAASWLSLLLFASLGVFALSRAPR